LSSFQLAAARFFVRFCFDDCFHNFCMNNIPVAQLQIASLVDELSSSREGFVTFDCIAIHVYTTLTVESR